MQHNVLGEWLHTNLCIIYEALDGSCAPEVGPLNEDQAFLPMQLHWPEGQPNIVQRLEEFKNAFSLAAPDSTYGDGIADASNAYFEEVKSKVDALSSGMQGKSDAVEGKVDAVEGKVDAVEGKVDLVQKELQELKHMMSTLIGIMAKD